MTKIYSSLKNFSNFSTFSKIFPESNDYIFTENKVLKYAKPVFCSCGTEMVDNGYNYIQKKGLGKFKIGKKICKTCKKQYSENKSVILDLLTKWKDLVADFITLLRDNDVSWQGISDIFSFVISCSKDKAKYIFDQFIDKFKYEKEDYFIVNYDEQHPKKGRSQKYRLTLINYETKRPIADELFDNKEDQTIEFFLRKNLDTTKKIVLITDCDRRYSSIFKKIWGDKVIHQKCLLHLNKLVCNDFPKNISLQDIHNKYLILNIFYNRDPELKYLEKLLKRKSDDDFNWKKERKLFYRFVRTGEKQRRRKKRNLPQRSLCKAKKIFDKCMSEIDFFPDKTKQRLKMIDKKIKKLIN